MTIYNPEQFRVNDDEAALRFIDQHDFAVVISHGDLHATHTPMTVIRQDDSVKLFGHFSRKNPHCDRLDGQTQFTCIFSGPHTYVSPAWYVTSQAVPTWNYSAAHVTGRASAITEPDELKRHLLTMIKKHDPQLDVSMHMPEKFMRGMMKGIVGFTLAVERLEFKQKLSQNRPAEDRRAVATRLSQSDDNQATAVAEAMQKYLDD